AGRLLRHRQHGAKRWAPARVHNSYLHQLAARVAQEPTVGRAQLLDRAGVGGQVGWLREEVHAQTVAFGRVPHADLARLRFTLGGISGCVEANGIQRRLCTTTAGATLEESEHATRPPPV